MIYKDIYRLKRVDASDFPAIKELFWKVLKKKISLNNLYNKYNTSYLGINFICSIAYYKDIPVAFYGAIPQKFQTTNKTICVAHACDSYTIKSHQRKGLHIALAKFAYTIMKQYDIKYVYAFHSKNTYLSTKKLNWKEHKHLQRFHLKTNTLPISKVLNKLNLNNIYNIFFDSETPKNTIYKLNNEHPEKFTLNFSNQFISYKNSFKTHYFFEAFGCIFWFKIQAIIHVGEFYAPNDLAFKKAIMKFKRKAFSLGISEILFQVDNNSNMSKYLQTITAPKKSWLVGYLDFDQSINLNEFLFSYSDLDTF